MKKFTQLLLMSVMIIGGLSLASCSDDNKDIVFDYDDSQETELMEGAEDLSFGRNVYLLNVDDLPEILTRVGSRKNILFDIENEEEFPFHIGIQRDEKGDNHIVFKGMKESVKPFEAGEVRPFLVNLSTADGTQKKQIRVTFRRSADYDSNSSEINTNYYQTIGKTMLPWTEYGGTENTVLDANYVAHAGKLQISNNLDQIAFEFAGSRYEDTMEQFSLQVGGSFKGPNKTLNEKKFVFSGGLNVVVDGSEEAIQNMEYYVSLIGKVMSSVRFDPGNIGSKDPEVYLRNASLNSDFLDSYADSVLNLKDTDHYKLYKNTKEDIFRLFDRFGTHVICAGSFGGSYIKTYSRYENAYQTTIGMDLSAEVRGTEAKKDGIEEWLDVWKQKNSNYLDFNTDIGYYSSDYVKATKSNSFSIARGGGVVTTDFSVWDNSLTTDNTDGWVIVSYKTTQNDNNTERNLVPLYEFIYEPERRQAVYDYMEEYVDDYSKKYPVKPEWTLILADVWFEAISDGKHHSPRGESFTGFPIGSDKDHPFLYVPMMANRHFPIEKDQGYAVETCQNTFLGSSAWGAHYWYYALGYEEKGVKGIRDIRLLDAKQDKEWLQEQEELYHKIYQPRGNKDGDEVAHSNTEVGVSINNNKIYILPAENSTSLEDKVKAIALFEPKPSTVNEYGTQVFATSGGCEWQRGWDGDNYMLFNDYWNGDKHDVVAYPDDLFYENGHGAILNHQFALLLNYSKLPIQYFKDANGKPTYGSGDYVGKLQAPLKWGE